MKKLYSFLFSTRLMAVLLLIFFISIATATFIENDYGTVTAWRLVYNAAWFNIMLFLGIINLLGVIIKNKMYRKDKFSIFIFHFSFVLILLGAAVTRFIGYEGTMTIREGQTTDYFSRTGDYITLRELNTGENLSTSKAVAFSSKTKNKAHLKLKKDGEIINLDLKQYVHNAVLSIEPVISGGYPLAELIFSGATGRESIILRKGDVYSIGPIRFEFEAMDAKKSDVHISMINDSLYFSAPFEVKFTDMADQSVRGLKPDSLHNFETRQLFTFNGVDVVLRNFVQQGTVTAGPSWNADAETGLEAIQVQVSSGTEKSVLWLCKGLGFGNPATVQLGKTRVEVSYGPKIQKLPFSITLTDFQIERYPGSNSPSWFESKVVLNDPEAGISEPRRIYMNNILKYKGFRFYQSSYDSDEMGTILSVNHDLPGTLLTYAGYLLMTIGMILSLMNKKSRFRFLAEESASISRSKKLLTTILFVVALNSAGFAQHEKQTAIPAINAKHAAQFGKVLVQDVSGRIEPINTLSSDVLRKIYRKDSYKNLNSDQVLLGMIVQPEIWQEEAMIYCSHPQIQRILGSKNKYFSFASFFEGHKYKLQSYVETAFRKKQAERTKFDNELIRLDERLNVVYMVFTGEFLKIFPVAGDNSHTWYTAATVPKDIQTKDTAITKYFLSIYSEEVNKSISSGDWSRPAKLLEGLYRFQYTNSAAIIPPASKQRLEILMNKTNIFDRISDIYGLVGFLLLLYQFIALFFVRIKSRIPVAIASVIIILLFIVHTLGLACRWYVSGHAPWSNGYEALTYIAWATILAGLLFSRRSAITLSVTSILAYLILFTAHLSWMDPQITNLVPVLKSYWLVIHVAVITASYGFLGLGALLASVNLLLMLFHNRKNYKHIDLSIKELSNVIEMALIVGLYMLTVGTFLGGVWANESWGRYWGWDAKETWALATVLLYAFISHMRMVPGLKGQFGFNLAALLGFSSVIMTYFGVNYYLSGLHSYAKGDQMPVPTLVYYTLAVIAVVAVMAYINQKRLKKVEKG
jgi:cytochrome c-type biogenesis protein CcsB